MTESNSFKPTENDIVTVDELGKRKLSSPGELRWCYRSICVQYSNSMASFKALWCFRSGCQVVASETWMVEVDFAQPGFNGLLTVQAKSGRRVFHSSVRVVLTERKVGRTEACWTLHIVLEVPWEEVSTVVVRAASEKGIHIRSHVVCQKKTSLFSSVVPVDVRFRDNSIRHREYPIAIVERWTFWNPCLSNRRITSLTYQYLPGWWSRLGGGHMQWNCCFRLRWPHHSLHALLCSEANFGTSLCSQAENKWC